MSDQVKFTMDQIVFSILDSEKKGIISGIVYRRQSVMYLVTWGYDFVERWHTEAEITSEKPINV